MVTKYGNKLDAYMGERRPCIQFFLIFLVTFVYIGDMLFCAMNINLVPDNLTLNFDLHNIFLWISKKMLNKKKFSRLPVPCGYKM